MDLVQRYIAAVQRELPEAKQQEIGRELNANIMDQLDALSDQQQGLTDRDVAAVLKHMGHPRTVAQQFVPPQPLISPGYLSLYQHTLFMVLGILFLLQVADSTIAWLSNNEINLALYLKSLASGFLDDAIFGFTVITLGFWLMSRQQPQGQDNCGNNWQPEDLPAAGLGWQHISLQDIFTDLATYLFLLLVIWYPMWMTPEQLDGSRIILSDNAWQFLKLASPLAILGMIHSLWQLRQRFWTRNMLLVNISINAGFVVAILLLATSGPLLQLDIDRWQGIFEPEQLERSAMLILLSIALFPLWEAGRDVLRLGKT